MRILIADDDGTSRKILSAVLRKHGHDVVETCDGTEALNAMQDATAPKLAILDWMMPGLDGVEVCRRIRKVDTHQPPYLIILTGLEEKDRVVEGLRAGANDYVRKPFDSEELGVRVEVGERMVRLQAELAEARRALEHQATHDELTDLPNRRAILEHLEDELACADRAGRSVSVGMLDIDRFKQVNDTHGHAVGDEVLVELARRWRRALRRYDKLGRYGGEEFLVVAPGCSGDDSPWERLRSVVADEPVETDAGPLKMTVSIGTAECRGDAASDRLIGAADEALYRAKEGGRNLVEYGSMDAPKQTGSKERSGSMRGEPNGGCDENDER